MGTINYGDQTITIQFLDSVDSGVVNKLTKDILPVGIYSGGKITKVSDTSVTIAPLAVLISDGTYQATIRTASMVTLAVSPSTPYVILRWTQPTAAGYYMDFMAVAEGDIQEHDLIVGKCIYSGSTMAGISYEDKTYPVNLNLFCKVVPEETPSMRVKVLDGWVSVNGTFHRIEAQYTSTIAAPSSNPRIDLVYIDESGTVQIETGMEAASPTPPSHEGKIPLAHIYLRTTTSSITENEIVDIRGILTLTSIPDGIVYDTGNQTIGGVKTFTSFPVTPSADPNADYQVANKQYVDKKSYENYNIGNHIKILTGTVVHGGTIPLPSGYTQSQCKWLVSPYNAKVYDSSGSGGCESLMTVSCYADSSRVVTARTSGSCRGAWTFSANYIIIGVK